MKIAQSSPQKLGKEKNDIELSPSQPSNSLSTLGPHCLLFPSAGLASALLVIFVLPLYLGVLASHHLVRMGGTVGWVVSCLTDWFCVWCHVFLLYFSGFKLQSSWVHAPLKSETNLMNSIN